MKLVLGRVWIWVQAVWIQRPTASFLLMQGSTYKKAPYLRFFSNCLEIINNFWIRSYAFSCCTSPYIAGPEHTINLDATWPIFYHLVQRKSSKLRFILTHCSEFLLVLILTEIWFSVENISLLEGYLSRDGQCLVYHLPTMCVRVRRVYLLCASHFHF